MRALARFAVQDMTPPLLEQTMEIKAEYGFSYWDSAVIATARALGCTTLDTEDLSYGRQVTRVVIIHPFC
jgi:predicted nucleic acid-binding protein